MSVTNQLNPAKLREVLASFAARAAEHPAAPLSAGFNYTVHYDAPTWRGFARDYYPPLRATLIRPRFYFTPAEQCGTAVQGLLDELNVALEYGCFD